uniref:Uncharacterized protein n=1 Tax=Arundo donax TaxID=35708 RepID=A0A0A8Z511_ARUDO
MATWSARDACAARQRNARRGTRLGGALGPGCQRGAATLDGAPRGVGRTTSSEADRAAVGRANGARAARQAVSSATTLGPLPAGLRPPERQPRASELAGPKPYPPASKHATSESDPSRRTPTASPPRWSSAPPTCGLVTTNAVEELAASAMDSATTVHAQSRSVAAPAPPSHARLPLPLASRARPPLPFSPRALGLHFHSACRVLGRASPLRHHSLGGRSREEIRERMGWLGVKKYLESSYDSPAKTALHNKIRSGSGSLPVGSRVAK